MKKLNTTLIAALAMLLPAAAMAKDLKTEITVDRTIVPVEREAVRLSALNPQLMQSQVKFRKLTLADYTKPAVLTRSLTTLDPAAYADTFALSPYKGYAAIGYFPAFNLGASAGYRFIDKSRTRLGAWFQYDGYSYKESGDDASKGTFSNNTVALGARFDQRVGDASNFSAAMAYSFAGLGMPDDFVNTKQNANMFDLDLGWWSRTGLIGYHAKALFSHFSFGKNVILSEVDDIPVSVKAAGENRFRFSGGIGYFGSSVAPRGGVEISADFINRSNGYEQIEFQTAAKDFEPRFAPISAKTLGVISLTPYYAVNSGTVHGRIGAKIELSSGGEGKKFHIAPAVMLDWNAASQFALYTRIEGGEHLNSLRSLFEYCPWANAAWQYQRSHLPVIADFGMNIGPFRGFSIRLFGGYAVANDWLMPQLSTLPSNDGALQTNVSNFGTYDLKGWHAGAAMAYDWRSIVKAELSFETAPQKPDRGYFMWRDRAKYVLKASVDVRPVDRLNVGVGYQLRTKRCNYAFDGHEYTPIDLGQISDLRLSAAYDISDALTAFVRVENLLNKRSMIMTDIETQGIKGLLGVSYKF